MSVADEDACRAARGLQDSKWTGDIQFAAYSSFNAEVGNFDFALAKKEPGSQEWVQYDAKKVNGKYPQHTHVTDINNKTLKACPSEVLAANESVCNIVKCD